MQPLQLYKIATWTLLVLNISILSFFFLTKPPGPRPGPGHLGQRVIKTLQLDQEQGVSFQKSAHQHGAQMEVLNEEQRSLLLPYFQSIIDTTQQINKEAILQQVQVLERNKIEFTYQHFEEIKALLKPDQNPNFDRFMNIVLEQILFNSQKSLPPPKEK